MIERYSRELSEEWCRERYEWVMYESSEEWYRKRYEREMSIVKYDAELSGTPCHMTVKCRGGPKDTTHTSNTYRMVLYIPWMYVIWWEVKSKSSESRYVCVPRASIFAAALASPQGRFRFISYMKVIQMLQYDHAQKRPTYELIKIMISDIPSRNSNFAIQWESACTETSHDFNFWTASVCLSSYNIEIGDVTTLYTPRDMFRFEHN